MSNFRDLWGGFVIGTMFILVGVIMSFTGGIVIDYTHAHFDSQGWFDEYEDWGGGFGTMNLAINLYYMFFGGACPIIGAACLIKSVIAREGRDQYIGW